MNTHIDKAKHNEEFIKLIKEHGKNDYNDWVITISFYAALHYIKAFLKYRKVAVGFSHNQIDAQINPDSKTAKAKLPSKIYSAYHELYRSSRNARYTAVYLSDFQELLLEVSSNEAQKNLTDIKKHLKTNEKFNI